MGDHICASKERSDQIVNIQAQLHTCKMKQISVVEETICHIVTIGRNMHMWQMRPKWEFKIEH